MSYPNYPNYPSYPAQTGGYPGVPVQQPQPGYPDQVNTIFTFQDHNNEFIELNWDLSS